MKLNYSSLIAVGLLASAFGTTSAYAVVPITFEKIAPGDVITIDNTAPGLTQSNNIISAPSIYVAAGNMQTITTDPATFRGGVLLGLATFFPAQAFANGNNVYGTADFALPSQGLSNTLSIVANNSVTNTTNVSFALFNGETFSQDYTIFADTSAGQFSFNTGSILANWQSGYSVVDVSAATLGVANPTLDFKINTIDIRAVDTAQNSFGGVFDFLIDSVMFNAGSLNTLPPPPAPPTYSPPLQNDNSPIVVQAPELQLTENERAVIDYGHSLDSTQETHVSILTDLKDVNRCGGKKGCVPDFQVQFETDKNGNILIDPITNLPIHKFELEFEDVVIPAQAVPEPESYAMMLAGVGVMGFVARRRRLVS
ncbi:MAG: PEP-CTERM sorting domain-containing protein [Methylophilaceae bacterium]